MSEPRAQGDRKGKLSLVLYAVRDRVLAVSDS